jgi:hypothetical protein
MYSMSYYIRFLNGVVNRNMHIAQELEKRNIFNRILHIDFLPYNVRSLARTIVYTPSIKKEMSNVQERSVVTCPRVPSKKREALIKKKIKKLAPTGELISWSYNPFELSFLDKGFFSHTIFDAVDDWRFNSVYKKNASQLQMNYKKISQEAEKIFTVSTYLGEMFTKEFNRPNIYCIPNTSELPPSKKKNDLHVNRVVYLGTIESRFDIELVEYLVHTNPTKHFTFIGPVWKDQKKRFFKLKKFANVNHMGEIIFSEKLADLLVTFDVGIIPHRQSKFAQSNDPLKVYDYLRAGLPVVSTIRTSEKMLAKYIYYADSDTQFSQMLSKALDENSHDKVMDRINGMKRLSWEKRVDQMLSHITL